MPPAKTGFLIQPLDLKRRTSIENETPDRSPFKGLEGFDFGKKTDSAMSPGIENFLDSKYQGKRRQSPSIQSNDRAPT